jgi:hypothetical protein
VATQLERSLQISNTQLGLIAAVSALAGAGSRSDDREAAFGTNRGARRRGLTVR